MPKVLSQQVPIQSVVTGKWVCASVLGKKCLNGASFQERMFIEIRSARPDSTMADVAADIFQHVTSKSIIPADLIEGFQFKFVSKPTPS